MEGMSATDPAFFFAPMQSMNAMGPASGLPFFASMQSMNAAGPTFAPPIFASMTSLHPMGPQLRVEKARSEGPERFDRRSEPPSLRRESDLDDDVASETRIRMTPRGGEPVAEMGNAMLDLLRSRDVVEPLGRIDEADPIQVRSREADNEAQEEGEFSVKARVFVGLHSCSLKVKFYAEEGPQRRYLVDFELCNGDELVFWRVYSMACTMYQRHSCCEVAEMGLSPEALGAQLRFTTALPAVRPSGQVASLIYVSEEEDLQADAALALARIAEDPEESEHLCNACVYAKVEKLLKSDALDVAWPTAHILLALSRKRRADGFLRSISGELWEKAGSAYTEAAVASILAEVCRADETLRSQL